MKTIQSNRNTGRYKIMKISRTKKATNSSFKALKYSITDKVIKFIMLIS